MWCVCLAGCLLFGWLVLFVTCSAVQSDGVQKRSASITFVHVDMALHSEFVGDASEIVEGINYLLCPYISSFSFSPKPLSTGTVISFRYDGNYTGTGRQGRPMNPRIYCVRRDIQNWDVVVEHKKKVLPTYQPAELQSMRRTYDIETVCLLLSLLAT